jgi:hypothetical protein
LDADVLKKYIYGGHVAEYMESLEEEDDSASQRPASTLQPFTYSNGVVVDTTLQVQGNDTSTSTVSHRVTTTIVSHTTTTVFHRVTTTIVSHTTTTTTVFHRVTTTIVSHTTTTTTVFHRVTTTIVSHTTTTTTVFHRVSTTIVDHTFTTTTTTTTTIRHPLSFPTTTTAFPSPMATNIFTLVNHRPTSFIARFRARIAINRAINQNLPAIQQAIGNPAQYNWVSM